MVVGTAAVGKSKVQGVGGKNYSDLVRRMAGGWWGETQGLGRGMSAGWVGRIKGFGSENYSALVVRITALW